MTPGRIPLLLASGVAGLICLGTGGCREEAVSPDIVPISGRVTCDGEPLPSGALVQFIPMSAGRPAFGPVVEDGRYTMTTHRDADGAHVARHLIRVYPATNQPTEETDRPDDELEYEEIPLPCPPPRELYVVITAEIRVVDIEMADGGSVVTR